MEVEKIQPQGCKFQRIGNGNDRIDANKMRQKGDAQYPDDEDEGEVIRNSGGGGCGGNGGGASDISVRAGIGRLCGWPSSRIVRVSRASGGKDRHSKVLTSKGLRDRRVRLSVTTALQFYDLQDRLGYDQPSKAVEWLLKAAASSIAELPSIKTPFPDTPNQVRGQKRSSGGTDGFDSADVEMNGDPISLQQQHGSLSKSACSSTSDTSKGSGLSLSRSESRIKARERARERAAEKEKEKEKGKENDSRVVHHQNMNPISQNASFTELLTGGISSVGNNTTNPNGSAHQDPGGGESDLFHKSPRQWSSAPTDNFAPALLGPSSFRSQQSCSGFSGQIHLGNSLPQSMPVSPFSISGDHHPELQHFSLQDHLGPVVRASGVSDYNVNFTISSGFSGFNRGTLQSNSPSFLPQLQRFASLDGSNVPFFIGAAAPNAPVENHHQFPPGLDDRLQLYHGNGGRHSDQKGKGKNRFP